VLELGLGLRCTLTLTLTVARQCYSLSPNLNPKISPNPNQVGEADVEYFGLFELLRGWSEGGAKHSNPNPSPSPSPNLLLPLAPNLYPLTTLNT